MEDFTRKLWDDQNRHEGDREALFGAIAASVAVAQALYPGSFVDVAASFAFPAVTYVDTDRRAARFFADEAGVKELIDEHRAYDADPAVAFLAADYSDHLDLADESFDLLISLYAGFVSEHCTRYLRIGGTLLVNPSHGDAAMASIDSRYKLTGVVISRAGKYRVDRSDLDSYLIPKRPQEITVDTLHGLGRGVGYTKSPFAYLFERVE